MKSRTISLTASALATLLLLSLAPRSSAASMDGAFTPACGAVPAGQARCFVLIPRQGPATGDRGGVSASPFPHSYGPSDLQSAYAVTALAATNGATQTVALVDANDDPTAESDLATYRAFYHLPPCTTANGCFRKVNQEGGTTYPAPNFGWAAEISTDLDMASAVCPRCHLLLVEAITGTLSDLGTGVNTAVRLGATEINNSYGTLGEAPLDRLWDAVYYHHPGIALTAASGDYGYRTGYPAASPYVTAVGGTALVRAATARGWAETAWSCSGGLDCLVFGGSSSGCSRFEPKPTWQSDPGCATRTIADVAAVASEFTPVSIYDSYQLPGWFISAGTSVAAPLIAGVYALAGNAGQLDGAARAYAHPEAFNDVTQGRTGTCVPTYLCTAGPGYDGPTGLGTPQGVGGF